MHLHGIAYVFLDVERAAFLNPDNFEVLTVFKCVFVHFFERAWKRNLFDLTENKAPLPDVLHTIRNFKALQIVTELERLGLESFQRGW